jgi:UDP-N-acetylmuramyl pentapeptide synthase
MSTNASSDKSQPEIKYGWKGEEIEQLLTGIWNTPPAPTWHAENIALNLYDKQHNYGKCLFIAMDEKTWHEGSGNQGIYAGWHDTHEVLKKHYRHFCGAIVQHLIPQLPSDFPQIIVENTYNVLPILADEARRRMSGKVIAITGTVGKSSTKDLLQMLLEKEGTIVATQGNHNTRTGTLVSLARCVTDPHYVVLEVAISALWMGSGGVGPRIKPHIVIITEIGMTQVGRYVKTPRDTARFKSRLCNGILPGGYAILNRDMDEYDFVYQQAISYGARVISYGFHPQADVVITGFQPAPTGSEIHIMIHGMALSYQLNVPGKGMASNSVAALVALDLLGLDVQQASQRIAAFHNKKGKLQTEILALPGGGTATLIDDNYNATLISMCNAIQVAALYPRAAGQRRIAVLGRLATLGTLAKESHIALAQPLLEAGFDKTYLHGEEMSDLIAALPTELIGGHFHDVGLMAQTVMAELQDGDTVLVKGSVSDSDFHQMVSQMKSISKQGKTALKPGETAGILVNLSTGKQVISRYADAMFAPHHLSHLLLISLLASSLNDKQIALTSQVPVRTIPDNILQHGPALALRTGQQVALKTLLQSLIIHNARDAAVNLAEFLAGDARKGLSSLCAQLVTLGMRNTQLNNVSGRKMLNQHTTLQDIALWVSDFYQRFPHQLHWFAECEMVVAKQLYRKSTNIQAGGRACYSYSAGGAPRWGFAIQRIGGQLWFACASGATGAFHLDYLLDELLAQIGGEEPCPPTSSTPVMVRKAQITVTVLGDTYFGEWYTQKRRLNGIDDALQRYGYDHSFLGLAPLLKGSDFTIANLETALIDTPATVLKGRKPFCLTGDPQKTASTLKRHGIHAVSLANNHTMDAGLHGLNSTLAALSQHDIRGFGAGMNAGQAHAPLTLTAGKLVVKFFSAYWFRRYMEQACEFYALPRRPGVACISGGLIELLRKEKACAAPATTIVIAHWGQDYQWTLPLQRQLARQLTDAGADLIIGSGSHMPGEWERLGQNWTLYSIGNAIFNSTGEFRNRGMPPYGFVTQLRLGGTRPRIELLPILVDNQQTFWKPRSVNEAEFEQVIQRLREQGVTIEEQETDDDAWILRPPTDHPVIVLPLDGRFGEK